MHQTPTGHTPQTRGGTNASLKAHAGAGATATRRKSTTDDESADEGEGTVENEGANAEPGLPDAQAGAGAGADAKTAATAAAIAAPPVDEADSIYTRYRLNFDPELVEIICESKYMELLGLPVPDLARSVALQVRCDSWIQVLVPLIVICIFSYL